MKLRNFLKVFASLLLIVGCEGTNPDLQDSLIDGMKDPSNSEGTSQDENNNSEDGGSNNGNNRNELEAKVIGEWRRVNNSKESIYILENGEGYEERLKSNGGILWCPFEWKVDSDKFIRRNLNSTSDHIYDLTFNDDGNIILQSDILSYEYKQISKNGTTNVNYKGTPYPNYICIFGYYYELSEVVMRCDHATGTEANMKHLFFFGANGSMEPIGARFMYSTPYYEGIDKMWYDGTYNIKSKSGYYIYGGVYCLNNYWESRSDGKLTIKSSGKIMTLDFNLDDGDAIGHFSGVIN